MQKYVIMRKILLNKLNKEKKSILKLTNSCFISISIY